MKLLVKVYALFLYLYPPAFRDEFGVEMRAVFLDALEAAWTEGGLAPLRLLLREIADLPGSLLRQHWTGEDLLPGDPPLSDPWAKSPGSRRAALLAGLPHLLFCLSIYMPAATAAFFGQPLTYRPQQFPFWSLTAILLVFAWSRGWPRWSSSWIGYGLVFLLDRIFWLETPGFVTVVLIAAWSALAIFSLLSQMSRGWMSGLLVVLPVAPMWVWRIGINSPFAILGKAMLYTSIGVLVCLAVMLIVRSGRWQTAALLMLAILLAVGPTVSITDIYSYNLVSPAQPYASTAPDDWLGNYLLLLFMTTPLWLLALWRQKRGPRLLG